MAHIIMSITNNNENLKNILHVNYDGHKAILQLSDNTSLTLDLDVACMDPEDVDSEEIKEWLMGEGVDEPSAEFWAEQIEVHYCY